MTVEGLISQVTVPLKPCDTAEQALDLMLEFRVRHLPVIGDNRALLGMLSEDQLLDAGDFSATVDTLIAAPPFSVTLGVHAYDAARILLERDLTTLPVLDENGRYAGLVERREFFELFAVMLAVASEGGIVVAEVDPKDYSIAQMTYIIEQNDAKVLSIGTKYLPDGHARITFKVNVSETSRVRHILEHHGYRIVASYQNSVDDDIQERIEAFVRYLEV